MERLRMLERQFPDLLEPASAQIAGAYPASPPADRWVDVAGVSRGLFDRSSVPRLQMSSGDRVRKYFPAYWARVNNERNVTGPLHELEQASGVSPDPSVSLYQRVGIGSSRPIDAGNFTAS